MSLSLRDLFGARARVKGNTSMTREVAQSIGLSRLSNPVAGFLVPIYAVWLREVKRALRDRGQLAGGISRPFLWVIVLGVGLNPYFRGEIYGEVRVVIPFTYLQFLFPAVIALNMMYTSVQSAVSVIADRQFGFMREMLVSPMPRFSLLAGKILGGSTVAMAHGYIVMLLARFADVPIDFYGVVRASGIMFLIGFSLTALGIVIANRIESFEGFGVFSNMIILPLYFLSSSVFPLDPSLTRSQTLLTYPEWIVWLVELNPMTYAVDALRGVLIGFNQFSSWIGPVAIGALGAVCFAIALLDFRRR